jgi:manganese/zinc/iron transport system permease protein
MLGDAISHAVLPGLAAAFFLSGSRASMPMFLGAVVVGILTALFTEWIRGVGKVDEGASMGVVFTSLFALGLLLIVQAADSVHLDPDCVLYGAIEMTPLDTVTIGSREIPQAVVTLSVVAVINIAFVVVFFKELKITSFDPALATTTGFNASLMHYLLMILVAVTAVASFECVGSILVVAMFVVPPAAAFMLTDRLGRMVVLSALLAAAAAILGHIGALAVPAWFGYQSTTTAGMMAVAGGLLFLAAAILGPRHGVLVKLARRRMVAWGILAEDIIALLYRFEERGAETLPDRQKLGEILLTDRLSLRVVLSWLQRRQEIATANGVFSLTRQGRGRAERLVRSHRLWEQYLASEAGVDTERIHDKAERLEHFTDDGLRGRLDAETHGAQVDPHGTPIPAERGERS